MKCQNVLDSVDKAIEQFGKTNPIKISYRIEDLTEAFEADHSSPIVRAFITVNSRCV